MNGICPDAQPHEPHEHYGIPAGIRRNCPGVANVVDISIDADEPIGLQTGRHDLLVQLTHESIELGTYDMIIPAVAPESINSTHINNE